MPEYSNEFLAFELLGYAYMQIPNYNLVEIFLKSANELRYSVYRHFLIIMSKVEFITHRLGSIIMLSENDVKILNESYKELKTLGFFFSENQKEVIINYWKGILNILLFIDLELFEDEFKNIPDFVKNDSDIRILYADQLSLLNNDKSYEAYKEVYVSNKNPEVLIKILSNLYFKTRYDEIIEFFKSIDITALDEEGRAIGFYIRSINMLYGFKLALLKYEDLATNVQNTSFLLHTMATLFFQQSNTIETERYLCLMRDSIKEENSLPRLMMAETCIKFGFPLIAIEILMPLYKYSLEAKKSLLEILLKSKNDSDLIEASELINDLLKIEKVDSDIYLLKAKLEMRIGNLKNSIQFLEASFELKPTVATAYNIISASINLNSFENVERILSYLSVQIDPDVQMLISIAYRRMGNESLSNFYSYRAFMYLGDSYNQDIFTKFVSMQFLGRRDHQAQIDFGRVSANKAIRLKNNKTSDETWICLDSETELINHQYSKYFGCQHFHYGSTIGTILRNRGISHVVSLENEEYTIVEIIERNVRFVRYCMDVLAQNDSQFFKSIPISVDDPITPLLPFLSQAKEHNEFLLNQYNFDNGMGLPIFTIAQKNYTKYLDAMLKILEKKGQLFFSGPNYSVAFDSKFVLTLSSLLFINLYGLLPKLEALKKKLYIPKSLIDVISVVFNHVEEFDMQTTGSMHIDEYGMPSYIPISETEKNNRLNFWRNLLLFVKDENINIVETIIVDKKATLIKSLKELAGNIDIDCALLAGQINGVLLSDDLFVRKSLVPLENGGSSSNFLALIPLLQFDVHELLDLLVSLSKCSYYQIISFDLMMLLSSMISSKPLIIGEGTSTSKFSKLLENTFDNTSIFTEQVSVMLVAAEKLYAKRLHPTYHEIIIIIINSIIAACTKHSISKISVFQNFHSYLLKVSKFDVEKIEFFRDLFE